MVNSQKENPAVNETTGNTSTQSDQEAETPAVRTGGGIRQLTLGDLTEIRQMAESLNPGVATRVSAADWESILVAVQTHLGLPSPRRVRYTPAPSVATQLAAAVGTLSGAVCQLAPSAPALMGFPPLPVPSSQRRPSGVSPTKDGKSVSFAGVTKKAAPTPVKGPAKAVPVPAAKEAASAGKTPERRRKNLIDKALRSMKSAGWKRLCRSLNITAGTIRGRIQALTDQEIENLRADLPPLVRISLITWDNLGQSGSWADEVENDAEFRTAVRRAQNILRKNARGSAAGTSQQAGPSSAPQPPRERGVLLSIPERPAMDSAWEARLPRGNQPVSTNRANRLSPVTDFLDNDERVIEEINRQAGEDTVPANLIVRHHVALPGAPLEARMIGRLDLVSTRTRWSARLFFQIAVNQDDAVVFVFRDRSAAHALGHTVTFRERDFVISEVRTALAPLLVPPVSGGRQEPRVETVDTASSPVTESVIGEEEGRRRSTRVRDSSTGTGPTPKGKSAKSKDGRKPRRGPKK